MFHPQWPVWRYSRTTHTTTFTIDGAGTITASGTAVDPNAVTAEPASGFIAGRDDTLPRFRLNTHTQHRARVEHRRHIRLVIRVSHQHTIRYPIALSLATQRTHVAKVCTTQHRDHQIHKRHQSVKKHTPASEAWVRERNTQDLAELAFALAARRNR